MANFQEMYRNKLQAPTEIAKKIRSGDRIWIGGGIPAANVICDAISDRAAKLENVDFVGSQMLRPLKCVTSPDYIGHINYHTTFFGGLEHIYYKFGNIRINSLHFSETFRALRDFYRINVVLTECSPMDEEGYFYLGCVGGSFVQGELIDAGIPEQVYLQVNKHQCFTKGLHNRIHISKVNALCEHDQDLPVLQQPEVTETDRAVAAYIVPHIPDGACIQIGLGGLSNAVAYSLMDKKNLSCQTEMFTDSMMELVKKGVMTGRLESCFAFGSSELYKFSSEGNINFVPIGYTNRFDRIAAHDNFISINSCLMSDLTGQVCSESIGHRQFSSTGGQLDFVKGARASKGGKSFLCMPSAMANKDGSISSKITLNLPAGAVVTTPRSEVMYIVTEYGIADLINKPIEQRVEAMISIAHPDFRESLRKEAADAGLIHA